MLPCFLYKFSAPFFLEGLSHYIAPFRRSWPSICWSFSLPLECLSHQTPSQTPYELRPWQHCSGSTPHKCNQKVWWDALNVGVATIPPVMSGLIPSSKLFLNNRTSSGSMPLTRPYCPSVWPPRHDNRLLGHGYDMGHRYFIWILALHTILFKLAFNE